MGDCRYRPRVSSFVGDWACGKTIRLWDEIGTNGNVHKPPSEQNSKGCSLLASGASCHATLLLGHDRPAASLQPGQEQPSSGLAGPLGRPPIVILPNSGLDLPNR